MPRRNYQVSTPGFVADHASVSKSTGRQFDWAEDADLDGVNRIREGTIVGERANGYIVPLIGATGEPAPFGILISSAHRESRSDAKTGYGVIVGGVIYENLLAEYGEVGFEAARDALVGTGFVFETYEDDRGE